MIQNLLAAILIALIIIIAILASQQPWLAPVLTLLMIMLSEVVFAAPLKYKQCDFLPYTCKLKDSAFSAAKSIISAKLKEAGFLPDPPGGFGLVGEEHSSAGECYREHAYHDEIVRYTGNHPGSLVGCDCCSRNKSIEQRWGVTLKLGPFPVENTIVGWFDDTIGSKSYLVDSLEIWQTGYCLEE
ncbi:MAG: hypothetical protein BWK78_04915 [Thiotrichaceae bacterium IS1]|nr:MAG: hypothetical protein BWK78_04915 [Thiotrichaceae bacterium IS1]